MRSIKKAEIPIIDVFAGPGGLGEGFSRLRDSRGEHPFQIALSIEKDPVAHRTLLLRSFYRQFHVADATTDYYRRLRGDITSEELFALHPDKYAEAEREAWLAELTSRRVSLDDVRERADERLANFRRVS